MSSKRRYFAGDSEMQAVIAAAGHFEVDPKQLAYEKVEKRHGFTKRRRRVVIAVDEENPFRGGADAAMTGSEEPTRAAAPMPNAEAERPEPMPPETPALAPTEPSVAPPVGPGFDPSPVAATEPEAPPAEPVAGEPRAHGLADTDEPAEDEDREQTVCALLDTLLDLADLDVEPSAELDGEDIRVDLDGPEREYLIEDGGELLDALDYLGYRMARQAGLGASSFRVDSRGFRGDREQALQTRALEAAAAVVAGGEPVVFEPLDPASRRIIHLAVREVEGVSTASSGDGFLKRVRIEGE